MHENPLLDRCVLLWLESKYLELPQDTATKYFIILIQCY